jgi:hypothetical protein
MDSAKERPHGKSLNIQHILYVAHKEQECHMMGETVKELKVEGISEIRRVRFWTVCSQTDGTVSNREKTTISVGQSTDTKKRIRIERSQSAIDVTLKYRPCVESLQTL